MPWPVKRPISWTATLCLSTTMEAGCTIPMIAASLSGTAFGPTAASWPRVMDTTPVPNVNKVIKIHNRVLQFGRGYAIIMRQETCRLPHVFCIGAKASPPTRNRCGRPGHGLWACSAVGSAHGPVICPRMGGPVTHAVRIPFGKTSYRHMFGPVTHLVVSRDRYMGP